MERVASMDLLAQVYVYVMLAVWLGYGGWTSAHTYRHGGAQDHGSRFVFLLGIVAPFIVTAVAQLLGVRLPLGLAPTAVRFVGGSVMLAGIVLWMRAISTMGDLFSINVDIPEDHRLVTEGVYAHLRHPAYAGMLATMLGYGIATADWVGVLAFTIIPAVSINYRIIVEEAELVRHFGDEYRAYAARVRRLVPFVY